MLFSSELPRTTSDTFRAWLAKKRAACPAELPAPTRYTSRPCVVLASLREAP